MEANLDSKTVFRKRSVSRKSLYISLVKATFFFFRKSSHKSSRITFNCPDVASITTDSVGSTASRIPFFHCKLYEHGASILILPARFRSSKNRVSSPLAKYFQNLPSLLSVNLAVITSLVVTTKPGNKFVSSTIYFRYTTWEHP